MEIVRGDQEYLTEGYEITSLQQAYIESQCVKTNASSNQFILESSQWVRKLYWEKIINLKLYGK